MPTRPTNHMPIYASGYPEFGRSGKSVGSGKMVRLEQGWGVNELKHDPCPTHFENGSGNINLHLMRVNLTRPA